MSDLFSTDHTDSSNNQTSSYLELSPLYGNNQEQQDSMRTFQDGKIKADCFSNTRVLGFPPGVGKCLSCVNLLKFGAGHIRFLEPDVRQEQC